MTSAEQPIPSSDLSTRVTLGIVMGAVAAAAIWFSDSPILGDLPFRLLAIVAAGLMMVEWCRIHRLPAGWGVGLSIGLCLALMIVGELLYSSTEQDEVLSPASFDAAWTGFAWLAAIGAVAGLAARRTAVAGGFLYIALPTFALIVVNWSWFALTFWVIIVTSATDIFAFFAGRTIGGPKLAPRISPNKTWAGLIGGVAGAAVCGWATARFFELGDPFTYAGAAMGVIAQAGDLYESWLKRRAGVKDSGSMLPGHGGVLDRLDGMLPVTVATFLIVATGLWQG